MTASTGSVAQHAARSAVFVAMSSYLQAGMGLLAGIILTRHLSPEQFGVFALATTIMMVFARIKLWGLNALIIAADKLEEIQLSTQFWLSAALSLLVVVVMAAASPALRLIYEQEQVLLAILVAAFAVFDNEGLASSPENVLARSLKYGVLSTLNTVGTFLSLLATVIYAVMGGGVWALLLGYALKHVIYCVGVWAFSPTRPRLRFSGPAAKALLGQGRFMLMGGIGSFLAFQYDDLIVGTLTNSATLGNYTRAYALSLVPMAVISGIIGVASATYARVKADRQALSQAVEWVLSSIVLVGLPAAVGLALIAPEFVPLVYTQQFSPAVPMLQILLLYALFRPLNDGLGGLAAALNQVQVLTTFGVVQSVAMLVGCTALTVLFGANGAALAAGLTVVAGFAVLYSGVLRHHVDVPYAQLFGPAVMACAAGALLGSLSGRLLPDQPVLRMLAKAGGFSAAYLLVMFGLGWARLTQFISGFVAAFMPGHQPAAEAAQPGNKS